MLGDHVTLGGEADAETELDVSEARPREATGKAGTGVVHTAPGHGHDDFVIGKQYGLEIYCPVDNAGRFTMASVPPGTYTFRAWRAGQDVASGHVVVAPERPVEVVLP